MTGFDFPSILRSVVLLVILVWLSRALADFPLAALVWIFSLFVFPSRPATGVSSVSVLGSARARGSAPGVLSRFLIIRRIRSQRAQFSFGDQFFIRCLLCILEHQSTRFSSPPSGAGSRDLDSFWRKKLVLLCCGVLATVMHRFVYLPLFDCMDCCRNSFRYSS
jgi:hypothetical protein